MDSRRVQEGYRKDSEWTQDAARNDLGIMLEVIQTGFRKDPRRIQ